MVKGIDKLRARLAKSGTTIEQAVGPVMLEGADRVVATARSLVPRDSGELAASIHHTGIKPTKRGGIRVSIVAGSDETRVGKGGMFQKARLVEFGTVKTPAQPFFFPAWRLNRRSIRSSMSRAMKAAIRKVNQS